MGFSTIPIQTESMLLHVSVELSMVLHHGDIGETKQSVVTQEPVWLILRQGWKLFEWSRQEEIDGDEQDNEAQDPLYGTDVSKDIQHSSKQHRH